MGTTTLPGATALGVSERRPQGQAVPCLAEVYEAELDYVFRCLKGLGVPAAGLDDAVQDVFVVVQKKLPDFDGRSKLRTWLYAIALRVARRYRERAATDRQRFVPQDAEAASPAALALEDRQRLALAQQALAALPQEKREVFVLAQVEQLSGPDVARVTGLPLNTVYSRLRAARAAFAAELARLQRRPGRRQP